MSDPASHIPGSPDALHQLLQRGSGSVHLVGVCGVGMAGLAALLRSHGLQVTGCDGTDGPLADWLRRQGVDVVIGHSADHILDGLDIVVRTAAVSPDSPEIAHASSLGIPVYKRGEVLPRLLGGKTSIAVSGTHGKTTTSSFLAQLLAGAGRDPSWCIGGDVEVLGGVAGAGRGPEFVVEADESDGTVALYHPEIAVVTNVEFDHMEHFGSVDAFEQCFLHLVAQTRRRVVFCGDDPRASRICSSAARSVSYGLKAGSDVRGHDLVPDAGGTAFSVSRAGQDIGRCRLNVPGEHNVLNALAAMAVVFELDLSADTTFDGLSRLSLPKRRFERVVSFSGGGVVSDYAHHPSEVAALVRTAREVHAGRLRAVFQPHRYTRTLALGKDFPAAFAGVDELVLAPVYAASEERLEGGGIGDLYRHFRDGSAGASDNAALPVVKLARSLDEIWPYYRETLREGDLLLVVGAGDVECVASDASRAAFEPDEVPCGDAGDWRVALEAVLSESRVRKNEPLATKTGLRVGAEADIWVDVAREEELVRLVNWSAREGVPLHILGAGFNVLASDLGVRGVVARLNGAEFRRLAEDGGVLVAGAGTPLSRVVDWAEEHAFQGFEFLHGIPGSVGGAARMNAGAWGNELRDVLLWIRCLKTDGSISIVAVEDLGMEYRTCRVLENAILLSAGFRLEEGDKHTIGERRRDIEQKRAWMKGFRSAGSVFKNPSGDYAGRLLEQAGFKGVRVGGAEISSYRANFLFTLDQASASDVAALIDVMKNRVALRSGVDLNMEVKWLS